MVFVSAKSGSGEIYPESRLGAALIILSGGRIMESMRTHGMARTTVYNNFLRVVKAINDCPQLKIDCLNDLSSLEQRASQFESRSGHNLFQWCTGAIDGIAIKIKAPPCDEVQNQNRFYSGNKKAHCLNLQVNRFLSFILLSLLTIICRLFRMPIVLYLRRHANS